MIRGICSRADGADAADSSVKAPARWLIQKLRLTRPNPRECSIASVDGHATRRVASQPSASFAVV